MLFGTPENRPTWIETRHLKMQKFKRGKTQVKLSKNQQTLPFWLLTGIKINKIHKVLYAFFEITFLPKSDRFRRPNIWLETNFCDVAQTLEIQWFRLKFALLRHLQLNQNVNISKDVCKKSPPCPELLFSWISLGLGATSWRGSPRPLFALV